MTWRPISEYPTDDPDAAPVVLARDEWKNPVLVVLKDGIFHVIPSSLVYYQGGSGLMTHSGVVEFMEIPE